MNIQNYLILTLLIGLHSVIKSQQTEWIYDDCGCMASANLRIFNGLHTNGEPGDFGGTEVDELNETMIGAITVANLNDTDGDYIRDNEDNNGVSENPFGRNELDLMKLIIEINGEIPINCSEVVRIESQGPVHFYSDYQKSTEITNLSFAINEFPKTIYVEAANYSQTTKDIIIKLFIGDTEHDEVKATAIWIESSMKYIDGITPNPYEIGLHEPLASSITYQNDFEGDLYGLGYYYFTSLTDLYYGGRILIKSYSIKPSNLGPAGLYFDVTRRLHQQSGRLESGTANFIDTSDDFFAPKNELPNDDTHRQDEDIVWPNLYAYDAPAGNTDPHYTITDPNSNAYIHWKGDFEEFVRFAFNPFPTNFLQENELGSRCSEKIDWLHGRCLVLKSSNEDPYDIEDQHYKIIDAPITHSQPTRTEGSGNGEIEITFLSSVITKGYTIQFASEDHCLLISEGVLIDDKVITAGEWNLIDPGKIKIKIKNNGTVPFSIDAVLFFSVLNSTSLFNQIKLE